MHKSIIQFSLISLVYSVPVLVRRNGQLLDLDLDAALNILGGNRYGGNRYGYNRGGLLDLDLGLDLGLGGSRYPRRPTNYGGPGSSGGSSSHNNGLGIDLDADVDVNVGGRKGLNADVDAKVKV